MRRANNFTRSKARCLASPTWKLPHCRRCYIGQVCPVRKGCRSTTVWIPSWLSSSRACCGIRQQSHQEEDHAAIPDQPVKLDRYVERAAFQFHPVRGRLRPEASVKDCAPSPLYGCCFMRALPRRNDGRRLPPLHAPSMGGTRALTLPLRFNCRPYSQRIRYTGATKWTKVIEDVWEHMSLKRRELQGYGKAIVPHVVDFQENKNCLVSEFLRQ